MTVLSVLVSEHEGAVKVGRADPPQNGAQPPYVCPESRLDVTIEYQFWQSLHIPQGSILSTQTVEVQGFFGMDVTVVMVAALVEVVWHSGEVNVGVG